MLESTEVDEVRARSKVIKYLPLDRMELGQSFYVPPEMMVGGRKRYNVVRQTIYRWGYKHGIAFEMRQENGGVWVKRVERESGCEQTEKQSENIDGSAVQDAPLQESGVQEAHPMGAG